ncbi:efflux RND transporter periplasmic adaptor subunit [Altericista sp. CCNU0014]|uniref:efflux RND transporter periplasmic adaptor subunit n=1 Tax=Altericista sp. CCNU0014 TaxID=3082949 RepID=UPI00384CF410
MKSSDPQSSNLLGSNRQFEQLQLFPVAAPQPAPKRYWLWGLVLLVVAGGGLAIWRAIPANRTPSAIAQSSQGTPPRAVETIALTAGRGESRVKLLGQVEASQRFTIRAQTDGTIEQLFVKPGDRVTVGMAIAVLDDTDQRLAVAEANARLAQQRSDLARLEAGTRPEIIAQRQAAVNTAKSREREARDNLQRNRNLVAQGAIAQRTLVEVRAAVDTAHSQRLEAEAALAEAKAGPIREEIQAQRANVASAYAALNQARLRQQRTQVTATSSGIVQTRQVSQGDLIQRGGELVTLLAGDRLEIFLEVPENLSGQVKPGTIVELRARALGQWKQRAAITGVVPSADTTSRRQRVRIELLNPPQGLLAGMSVEAQLVRPNNRTGFVVSRDVLSQRQNRWFLFTVVDGKAKPIRVDLLSDMGPEVAVSSPELRNGQPIVSRGADGLRDGMAVKVVKGAAS